MPEGRGHPAPGGPWRQDPPVGYGHGTDLRRALRRDPPPGARVPSRGGAGELGPSECIGDPPPFQEDQDDPGALAVGALVVAPDGREVEA